MNGTSPGVMEHFSGFYPWTPAHPCYHGHMLVDEPPMVCDRCGAWLVYHPNGRWAVNTEPDDGLVTDGGTVENGTERCVREGDVFELLPELDDGAAHAAVVDYPWKFNGDNGTGRFQSTTDSRDFEVYDTEPNHRLPDVLEELARALVPGAWVFVFADDDTAPEFRQYIEESPLTYRRTCVWDREKFGMGYYHRVQHYPILTATNGDTERYVQGRGTVFRAARNDFTAVYNDDAYPTSKPVELYRQMLAPPVIEQGERLLEPFCGHAPGASVAAERGLAYWGAETNTEAVEVARDSFEQQRLGQTTLVSDGSGRNGRSVEAATEHGGGDSR